jgi:hypothetical protein
MISDCKSQNNNVVLGLRIISSKVYLFLRALMPIRKNLTILFSKSHKIFN